MDARSSLLLMVGLVVGLVVGVVGRSLLGPESARRPEPVSVSETATGEPRGVDDLARSVGERSQRRAAAARDEVAAPVIPSATIDAARARAIEAVESAPSFDDRTGGPAIVGRVVDVHGAPVEGVVVALTDESHRSGEPLRPSELERTPPYTLRTLDEALDAAARSWRSVRARTRLAESDGDGAFRFDGLAPRSEHGWTAFVDGGEVLGDGPFWEAGDRVRLVVHRIVPVEFKIFDEGGASANSCELLISAREGDGRVLWSDETPTVELIEGRNVVAAVVDPFERIWLHDADWSVKALASSEVTVLEVTRGMEPVELVLRPSDVVRVTFGGAGLPPDFGGELALRASDGSGSERSERMREDQAPVHFGGVDPGRLRVELRTDGSVVPLAKLEFDHPGGLHDVVLPVPELVATESVRVRVLGPDGTPVERCIFGHYVEGPNGVSRSGARDRALGDGWWEVWESATHALADGPPRLGPGETEVLRVVHKDHGQVEIPLVDGVEEYEVHLEAKAVVAVDVPIEGLPPGRELDVKLLEADGEGAVTLYGGGSDDLERFSARRVEPGAYDAVLVRDGHLLAVRRVALTAGENAFVLTPDLLHTVDVSCPHLSVGDLVSLSSISDDRRIRESTRRAALDEQRLARFEGLRAGRYRLRTQYHEEEVEVPCGTVLVDARGPDALRVVIHDEDATLVALGLADGDLVVGVDGVAFGSWTELVNTMSALCQRELVLLVDRDGATITVTTPVLEDREPTGAQAGGRLLPVVRPREGADR